MYKYKKYIGFLLSWLECICNDRRVIEQRLPATTSGNYRIKVRESCIRWSDTVWDKNVFSKP